MCQIDGTILTDCGVGYPKKMDTDTKEKQIIEAGTKLLTETMDSLDKSPHGWWQLPIVLVAIAIAISIAAIAIKFDPNIEHKPIKIEPTASPDIYKGLNRPQDDDLKFPLCTRRGEGFNCET